MEHASKAINDYTIDDVTNQYLMETGQLRMELGRARAEISALRKKLEEAKKCSPAPAPDEK